jgi:hypothetical protein
MKLRPYRAAVGAEDPYELSSVELENLSIEVAY